MKLRYKALDWSVRVKKKSGRKTHSGHFLGSSLGTGNALFSCFDHLSYFDHNLLISDPI